MQQMRTSKMILHSIISVVFLLFNRVYAQEDSNGNFAGNVMPFEQNWYYFENYYYVIGGCGLHAEDKPLNWAEAHQRCSDLGGELAVIHSQKEIRFLSTYIVRIQNQFWILQKYTIIGEILLEFNDEPPMDHINGEEGGPVYHFHTYDDGEACVEILSVEHANSEGRRNDSQCENERRYICKIPTAPITTENEIENSGKGEKTTEYSVTPNNTKSRSRSFDKAGSTTTNSTELSVTRSEFHNSNKGGKKKVIPGLIPSLATVATCMAAITVMILVVILACNCRQQRKEKYSVFYIFGAKQKHHDKENLLEIHEEVSENFYVKS